LILYKALKYKIIEYCLDSICNSISRNFIKVGQNILQLKDLHNGMRVSRIDFDGYTYIDCVIEFNNEIGKIRGNGDHDEMLYYLYIVCREADVPESYKCATVEKTGHYLFELKLTDEECVIYA